MAKKKKLQCKQKKYIYIKKKIIIVSLFKVKHIYMKFL